MAEPISIQQLKDASEDAISLADFINKPENVMIPRRLASDINSLQYYLDYMKSFAQRSYETYDEMVSNASNLSENVSVFVTNDSDTSKNGIYTYNGTSFVKGEYQPENAAKDFVEAKLGGLEIFDGKVRAQDVSTSDGSTQDIKNTEFREELDALPFEGGVLADTFVAISSIGAGGVSRDLRDKLRDSISVLDFGADPTGTIDAKAAFRAANAYATSKGITLEVPYGTYEFFDSTLIDITCNIRGEGKIKGSVRLNGNNLTMSGLEIDGGYNPDVIDSPSNGQLFVAGTNNTVFNCHVHHTNGSGAIYVFGGKDTKILFCNVHDCYGLYGDGIFFNRGRDNLAAFNTVKRVQRCGIVGDTDTIGFLEHNLIITGNHLDNTGAPLAFGGEIGAGIWCENVANTTITNNIIRNFPRRGIVINPETLTNTGEHLDANFTNIVEGNEIHSTDSLCVGIALAGGSDKGVFRITNNSLRGKYVLGIEVGSNKDVLIENVSFKGTFENKISIYAGEVVNATVTTNVTLSRLIKDVEAYPHVSVAGKCDVNLVGTGYCNLTIDNLRGEWEIKHPDQEFLGAFKANNCTLRFSEVQSPSNPQVYLSSFNEASFIDSTLNIHHTTLRTIGKLKTTNCNIKSYAVGGTNITNPFNSGFITSKGTDFEKVRFKLAHSNNNAVILFQSCNFKDYGDFAIAPDGGLTGDPWQLKVYETTFENSDATKPPFTFNGNPVWGKNQFRNIYYNSDTLFSDTFRNNGLTQSGIVKIGTSAAW